MRVSMIFVGGHLSPNLSGQPVYEQTCKIGSITCFPKTKYARVTLTFK